MGSSLVLSGDYGMEKDNNWPTKKKMHKTSRPTKWSPPSYEKEREWMKNWEKPTVHMSDEPTYEKEPVYFNPYDIRKRRSAMTAQLKEQIESDKQELAALDALEIGVSEEQDEEGVKQATFFAGVQPDWTSCRVQTSMSIECRSGCCEGGRCVPKKRDWANIPYCPRICRGGPFSGHGTC